MSSKIRNAIMVIKPYGVHGAWVFYDAPWFLYVSADAIS